MTKEELLNINPKDYSYDNVYLVLTRAISCLRFINHPLKDAEFVLRPDNIRLHGIGKGFSNYGLRKGAGQWFLKVHLSLSCGESLTVDFPVWYLKEDMQDREFNRNVIAVASSTLWLNSNHKMKAFNWADHSTTVTTSVPSTHSHNTQLPGIGEVIDIVEAQLHCISSKCDECILKPKFPDRCALTSTEMAALVLPLLREYEVLSSELILRSIT